MTPSVARRVVVALLAVTALLCAWQGLRPLGAGTATAATEATSPLLSPRRAPAAVAAIVADQRLAATLDAILAGATGTQSCLAVRLDGGAVYSRAAGTPLMPASNLKLLTAFAALTRLGPDARLHTVATVAAPPRGGVVNGPLFLVGGGDPLLATPGYRATQRDWTEWREPITPLSSIADQIRARGITRITGGVVGDDARFDDTRALPSWKASYASQIGPVGALVVDGGTRPDPAAGAAAALASLLRARGVDVAPGGTAGRQPPAATTVADLPSLPVSAIVGEMLRESDNLAAELLTKELGHDFGGAGTWPAGVGIIRATLVAAGIPVDGLFAVDGSGLDRSDRVSCTTLVASVGGDSPVANAIQAGLPTAGACGTLVGRLVTPPERGRVRAKTGSLLGVASLTGIVAASPAVACPPTGPTPAAAGVTFSFVVNGVASDRAGSALADRVAAALATYPALPVLDPFEPQG